MPRALDEGQPGGLNRGVTWQVCAGSAVVVNSELFLGSYDLQMIEVVVGSQDGQSCHHL